MKYLRSDSSGRAVRTFWGSVHQRQGDGLNSNEGLNMGLDVGCRIQVGP